MATTFSLNWEFSCNKRNILPVWPRRAATQLGIACGGRYQDEGAARKDARGAKGTAAAKVVGPGGS